MKVEEALGE